MARFTTQVVAIVLSLAICGCSRHERRENAAGRLISLLAQWDPNGRKNTMERLNDLTAEIDTVYETLVRTNDIEALRAAVDSNWYLGASVGVFGIREIGDNSCMETSDSEKMKKAAYDALAELASHENPHVRGAALYALGQSRRHEYRGTASEHVGDRAYCDLFFPPFTPFAKRNMSTKVGSTALMALQEMLGESEYREHLGELRASGKL